MRNLKIASAIAATLLIVGCGDDASDTLEYDGESGSVSADLSYQDGDGLGSVNLPRPDWMPASLPLPKDAHIYVTTENKLDVRPIRMLQARSMEEPEKIAGSFMEWARANGLDPKDQSSPSVPHLTNISFNDSSGHPSTFQVMRNEGEPNNIVIAIVGDLPG